MMVEVIVIGAALLGSLGANYLLFRKTSKQERRIEALEHVMVDALPGNGTKLPALPRYKDEIQALRAKVERLEDEVAELPEANNAVIPALPPHEVEIESLQDRCDEVEARNLELHLRNQAMEDRVAALKQRNEEIESRVASVEQQAEQTISKRIGRFSRKLIGGFKYEEDQVDQRSEDCFSMDLTELKKLPFEAMFHILIAYIPKREWTNAGLKKHQLVKRFALILDFANQSIKNIVGALGNSQEAMTLLMTFVELRQQDSDLGLLIEAMEYEYRVNGKYSYVIREKFMLQALSALGRWELGSCRRSALGIIASCRQAKNPKIARLAESLYWEQ